MAKTYIKHNAGIMNLFSWLYQMDKFKEMKIKNNVIYMPLAVSKRFGLGVPRKKRFGKSIFLGVQSRELFWATNIIWKEAVIQYYDPMLYLISQRASVQAMPAIPSFALAIPFDNAQKAYACNEVKRLDIRGIWFDKEKICNVERGEPRSKMRLRQWNGELFSEEDLQFGQTVTDIINQKISQSNVWADPGYKGEKNDFKTTLDLNNLTPEARERITNMALSEQNEQQHET